MTNDLAVRILNGDVLGTTEQTHEAVAMAIKALSADVQPVRYGKWIKVQCKGITSYGDGFAECDKCHEVSWLGWNDKYCRNCGARMDEGRE